MKLTQKNLRNSVAFALLLIATMQVSAQSWVQNGYPQLPPFKFTVTLTATVEGGFYGGPPVSPWTRETTTTTHWTSQSLLNFAESALSKRFPTNASLAQSYTNIVVVDATGTNVVENLTADGIATITISDTSVSSWRINENTTAGTGSQSYIFRFSFDDGNGNSCNLTGLAREKNSQTAVDQFLNFYVTETVSSTLIGEGFVGGDPILGSQPAVFTGSSFSSGTDKPNVRAVP